MSMDIITDPVHGVSRRSVSFGFGSMGWVGRIGVRRGARTQASLTGSHGSGVLVGEFWLWW